MCHIPDVKVDCDLWYGSPIGTGDMFGADSEGTDGFRSCPARIEELVDITASIST